MHWILAFLLCQPQDDLEQLKKRMAAMEEELKKLKEEKTPPQQEDVEKLKKKMKRLENDLEQTQEELKKLKEKGAGQDKPAILGALNPAITVFLNAAMRADTGKALDPDGNRIDDSLLLRTGELDFRASVDPYVDGVVIFDISQRGDEFEIEVEEGYGVIKRLPIIEAAPLGMRLKIGRYRAPIGFTNLLHEHDLPWTTRPIMEGYITGENLYSESGYNMDGGGVSLQLPSFERTSFDLNVNLAQPGRVPFTKGNEAGSPALLGRLGFFWKPGDTHQISLGASGYVERGDLASWLVGFDVMYRWLPVGEFRSLVVGGEIFYVDRRFNVEEDDGMGGTIEVEERTRPVGLFVFAQYQIDWHWYVGVRYDYAQHLGDDGQRTQDFASYVSYYTSEFFRIRLGYEYRWGDLEEEQDDLHSLILEFNFVIGSHPPEPWWVNR